ncbi:MAG: RecX family transcriptional regulator [Candidatus Doudnabacteria bacterium]|nr:RecX family transcriptional regulator [Candidatus Doudnabacteria bacterium]
MFKPKIKARQPESFEKAYDYAMYLLNLQLRTSGELESKMKDKGYQQETIHKVLVELAANKYIDDQRYAEVYLENLKKYKTFGFYGIKKKLMEKRLSNSLIEKVLGGGLGVEEEMKIAKKFALKQKSRIKSQEAGRTHQEINIEKQKLAQKLRARGFRSEIIMKVCAY